MGVRTIRDKLRAIAFNSSYHNQMRIRASLTLDSEAQCLPGIGSFAPYQSVLIVGDAPAKHHDNFPFISLRRNGCSWWLADQLSDALIPEQRLYWVNAFRENNSPEDLKLVAECLKPRYVACLGRTAYSAFIAQSTEYPIRKVLLFDHPQFHKRFKYNQPYKLIEFLKAVNHGTFEEVRSHVFESLEKADL